MPVHFVFPMLLKVFSINNMNNLFKKKFKGICVFIHGQFAYLILLRREENAQDVNMCNKMWTLNVLETVSGIQLFHFLWFFAFRLNGGTFSGSDVVFISSVLTICIFIMTITICLCLAPSCRPAVRKSLFSLIFYLLYNQPKAITYKYDSFDVLGDHKSQWST